LSLFPTDGFRSRIGAEVCTESCSAWRRSSRARANHFILAAAEEAVHSAALGAEDLAEAAVSIGGAGGSMLEAEAWYWSRYAQRENKRLRWTAQGTTSEPNWWRAIRIGGPRETPILAWLSAAAITTIVDLIETAW
jgi:3-oxoacyl-(acyl-carrier-protein) synthase